MICDLAQYYGIYSYRQLPARTVAVFVKGLPLDSRIMRKLDGRKCSMQELLTAQLIDSVNALAYMLSDKSGNAPERIVSAFIDQEEENDFMVFESGEEFRKAWANATKGA